MFQSIGGDKEDLVVPESKKKKKGAVVLEPYRYSENIVFERLPYVVMECESQEEFSDRASTPLNLESQSIHVDVVAGTAKVTSIMTFFNSTNKTLAGELVFPLPKDTSIHGYGLDINGVMIDAVPVPKEQARVAFETTVREHGPEVSIAEQVDAMTNSFKTRIYPIHGNSRRTVKVVVLTKLIEDEKNQLFFWNIQKPASLKNFKFTMNSPQGTNTMIRRSSGAMEPSDPTTLEATSDFEGILLVVPKNDEGSSAAAVVTEKDPDSGYTYFSATFSNLESKTKKIDGIKKATIFYDVSSSRRFSEWKEELKLVRLFMERNQGVEIDFYTFSNCVHEKNSFSSFEDLAKYAQDIKFDGGTCVPLKQIGEVTSEDSQIILLLSDGVSNYGGDVESELMKMRFSQPIYCVSSSPTSSYILLRYLGQKSGGGFYDVSEEDIESVVGKIGVEQFGVRNLVYDPIRLSEVFHSPMVNNAMSVYGRILTNENAGLEVDFGNGQVLKTEINGGSSNSLVGSTIIRTLWAQQKIQSLTIFADRHREEITRLGMEYGIVTENTSLIVLSDLSQYQKYKIVPPKSLKDVRKQYLNEIESAEKVEEERVKGKIDQVARKWEARIEWHKRDYKPLDLEKKEEEKQKDECVDELLGGECCMQECCCDCCGFCDCFCSAPAPPCEVEEEEEEEEERIMAPKKKKKKKKKKKMASSSKSKKGKGKKKKKEKAKKKPAPKKPKPSSSASISVKAFVPDSEYLDAISSKDEGGKYDEYLKQKDEGYEESPSFYLDVADYFITVTKSYDTGVRILSNIAELELNNVQLMRIIGYRLDQAEKYEEAVQIFEKVLKLKPEEPQSYRDLALVIEKLGMLERAAELLWNVITMKVDGRFDEIELTAAIELNHVLEAIEGEEERNRVVEKLGIDKRFIYHMDCDVRISMAWDTDSTDIDLHVYDPDGEHCFYSHKNTAAGGFISRDFVRGYGPEEFMQKKVWKDGKFRITSKYFASHQQSLTGGTTILCTFFTHYLKPQEKRELVTLRLTSNKQEVDVCEIDFKVVN